VRGSGRFSGEQLTALGVPDGAVALVEFTAPHCAPCTAARQVLEDVARDQEAVVVSVDLAEPTGDHLARAHRVLRAPTTFVVAPDGHVRGRVSGVPRHRDLEALLGP
jgi:thiol-disulfide isomerase/thioredoxin